MATFVIVHGAFGGGWQWREVATLLRARGHDVFTPSLTGLAERVHLAHHTRPELRGSDAYWMHQRRQIPLAAGNMASAATGCLGGRKRRPGEENGTKLLARRRRIT
jgi:hypothetical protein